MGFDEPVHRVYWSSCGRWLACLGGTKLVVVFADSRQPGDSAIICCRGGLDAVSQDSDSAAPAGWTSAAWCPASGRESVLAALERPPLGVSTSRSHKVAGCVLLYDVMFGPDGGYPRRVSPFATIANPFSNLGGGPLQGISFGSAVCVGRSGTLGCTASDEPPATLLIYDGDFMAVYCIPISHELRGCEES